MDENQPIVRPLTAGQRADAAQQPIMTWREAQELAWRTMRMRAEEAAKPVLPYPWLEGKP